MAAALLLAGCSLFIPPPKPQHASHPVPRSRQVVRQSPTGSAAAAAMLRPRPSLSPPATPRAPIELVGMSQTAVRDLLGPPSESSTRGASQTWTYEGPGCRLEVVFYYDVTRNEFFALSQQQDSTPKGTGCLMPPHDVHAS